MKTTLNIDDTVMARLRQEAACQQKTMSELVEAALRLLLHSAKRSKEKKLRPLPNFHGGKQRVDIADRNALYDFMEGRR
jgi:Arc/MetJ family transcription regulator